MRATRYAIVAAALATLWLGPGGRAAEAREHQAPRANEDAADEAIPEDQVAADATLPDEPAPSPAALPDEPAPSPAALPDEPAPSPAALPATWDTIIYETPRAQIEDSLAAERAARRAREADATARPLYMDVGVRTSRAPDGTLMFEPAFELSRQVGTRWELGLGLSGGNAPLLSGQRTAFSVAPSVGWRLGSYRLHGYGHVGLAVQYRGGARLPDERSLAVFGALGTRLNLGLCVMNRRNRRGRGCMTAGTEVRLQRALIGGWLMDPAVLPRGASTLSTSVTLGWEV